MPSPNEILAALRAAAAAGDRDAASFVHMYQPWVLTLAEPQVVNPCAKRNARRRPRRFDPRSSPPDRTDETTAHSSIASTTICLGLAPQITARNCPRVVASCSAPTWR